MSAYSLDLREKIVKSVKKGAPKAETVRDAQIRAGLCRISYLDFREHTFYELG